MKNVRIGYKGFIKGLSPWNKGKKCPEISKSLKGNKPWNKGKSMKSYPQCGFKKKHLTYKGCEKTQFKKGIRPENYIDGRTKFATMLRNIKQYQEWRSDIFERDNWTCQTCQKRGCYLEVHHLKELVKILRENNIKTFDEARKCQELWNRNNGVTLCRDCHNLTKRKKS
jgi:hypothetical protein